MENLTKLLAARVAAGLHRIGQIEILRECGEHRYGLCLHDDLPRLALTDGPALEMFDGPQHARELSLWAADGSYRFAKGQANLRGGWLLRLADAAELRQALDGFYPAALGLWAACGRGQLRVVHLRDKLERQTGMYRFARTVSDAGAQALVQSLCGPSNQCAKRILWQISANTPLADSAASRYPGIGPGLGPEEAMPLLCQEACNHFVAECRRVAKEEREAESGGVR